MVYRSALFRKGLTGLRDGGASLPCGFSKNAVSREKVKPCFFVTFDIIIRRDEISRVNTL